MLPGVAFFQRWFKSLQKPKITFWNVPLLVHCTDKFEFLYVTWEFHICAAEKLHDNYFLLHYYDILLADAFLQKQTLKAQEQDITNKKTLLVHNKYNKSA